MEEKEDAMLRAKGRPGAPLRDGSPKKYNARY
jgi:hypothetical protein